MADSIRIDDLAAEINRLVEDYGKQCTETTKEWNCKLFYRNNTAGMEQRCYIFCRCSGVVVRYLAAGIRFLCKYLDDNDAESGYIRNCDNDHNAMAECS